MDEAKQDTSEAAANVRPGDIPASPAARVPRCVECLGTIPAPRRKLCSIRCARRRKTKLNDYNRRRARL